MSKKIVLKMIAAVACIALVLPLIEAILPQMAYDKDSVYADQPGDTSPIKALICQPGTDETELNFAWLDNTGEDGTVYVAEKTDDPELLDDDGFPLDVQFEEWSDKTPLLYKTNNSRYYADYETNRATVSGLEPDVDYVYRVGNGDEYSDIYDFRIKGTKEKWSFYFSGDPQLNNTYGSQNYSVTQWISTIDKITRVDPDASLFVLGGDLADAGGGDESQLVEGLLAPEKIKNFAVSTSVGNHDQFTTGLTYRQHFNQPNQTEIGSYANTPGDYWYRYHNALFIHLTTSIFNDVNKALSYVDQHDDFIRQVLEDNPDVDWRILVFHEPIFSSGWHTVEDATRQYRPVFGPILKEIDADYGIDVVLNAHEHIYSRSYFMDGLDPVNKDKVNTEWDDPEGVLHVTANTGSGIKFYDIEQPAYDYICKNNQERTPNISDIEIETDPYNTSFHMTTYRTAEGSEYKASYGSMTIVDEFTINKTSKNQMMRDEINIKNDEYGVSVKIPAIFSQEETKMVVDKLTSGETYDKFKAAMEADETFDGVTINSEVIDVKTDWFGQNLEFEDDADLFIKFPEEFATESYLPPYNVYSLDGEGNVTEPETRLVKKAGELGVIVKTKQTGSYALAFAGEAKPADNPNPENPGGNNGTGTQPNTGNTANVNTGTNTGTNTGSVNTGTNTDAGKVLITKISSSKKKITLKVKKSFKIKVTVKPDNASNKKLKFTSSNKKVAKVNKSGKITALKKGNAVIKVLATDGSGKSFKIKVKVK